MVWLSDLLVYGASYGSGIALIATGASNLHHSNSHSTSVNVGLICAGVLSICVLPFILEGIATMGACAMSAVGYRSPLWDEARRLSEDTAKVPVLYSDHYNITAFGLEKMHPFDSVKYGRIYRSLTKGGEGGEGGEGGVLAPDRVMRPSSMPGLRDLLVVHSPSYLIKLHSSFYLSKVLEVPVFMLPSALLRDRVLKPMLYGSSGSIIGAQVACRRGWAINLSGGYHHAHACGGSGFCVYADITLAIQHLRLASAASASSYSPLDSLTVEKGAGSQVNERRRSKGQSQEQKERRQQSKRSSWVYEEDDDDDDDDDKQPDSCGAISVEMNDDDAVVSAPSSPLSPSSASWTFSTSSTPISYQSSHNHNRRRASDSKGVERQASSGHSSQQDAASERSAKEDWTRQGGWERPQAKHQEEEKGKEKQNQEKANEGDRLHYQHPAQSQQPMRGGAVKKVMIVDVDAHQGNGHERDFLDDKDVYILDVYNPHIFPHDVYAKRGIRREVRVDGSTSDRAYLARLRDNLDQAFQEFAPDLVVYNAGTDCMINDPLGRMSLSDQAIIDRDELVFGGCLSRGVPVLMLLSGGYQRTNAPVIARSITNLHQRFQLLK